MTQFASTLYPQTNPTNPILLYARKSNEAGYLSDFIRGALYVPPSLHDTPATIHARKVLTRLAALSG